MRLLTLFTLLLLPLTSAFAEQPIPGKFDYYVLAMSYMNDFCASHPSKTECQKPMEHPEMALHGLWPNVIGDPKHTYQYCDLPEVEIGNNWCNPAHDVSSQMSAAEMATLGEVMPGVQSCLYNHEWYAHGSCSGLDVKNYFASSAKIAKTFRSLSNFQDLLKLNYGKQVKRVDLVSALVRDIGIKAVRATRMDCRRQGGVAYLAEIQLTLDRGELESFPARKSLVKKETKKDLGSCPAEGITITSAQASAPLPSDTPLPAGFVKNPCPCSQFPGKSFCKSTGFALNTDGSITNYRDDKKPSIVFGIFASVEDFIAQKVCQ